MLTPHQRFTYALSNSRSLIRQSCFAYATLSGHGVHGFEVVCGPAAGEAAKRRAA
jgi:hypothetical protein